MICLRGKPLHLPLAKIIIEYYRKNSVYSYRVKNYEERYDVIFGDDIDLNLLKEIAR